ncbi:three component ABC system middle component [Pseudoalteromonas sp. 1_2015MBL_MicDiv]|uniref:three component ABC system middle component n=1 Tax=Pseudoalteromonas sp. 1_2015MBL_MicDiv TaxID=1720343 RepID=UPI000BBE2DCE|nr:three component ABC system middle component [Pseudoalteromonas sp. 1_2015MBL_MicDiv]ATG77171.1 hypothetical protein AOR04_06310 [Pseudoalteromonas sp. 1_2015MBL_MicDiv]
MQNNEISELLNPAFCALLYSSIVDGYNSKALKKIPLYLPYILIPIILHKESRLVLPKTAASKFHLWLQNEPQIVVGLTERVNSLEPYISKSSLLLRGQGIIDLDEDFRVSLIDNKKINKMIKNAEYISEYTFAAKKLGAICGRFNCESTMLALLGIKL